LTLCHFGVKAARNLEQRVFAVLREAEFDIDSLTPGTLVAALAFASFKLKTKTTKTR
jgi:hypothetical protein